MFRKGEFSTKIGSVADVQYVASRDKQEKQEGSNVLGESSLSHGLLMAPM